MNTRVTEAERQQPKSIPKQGVSKNDAYQSLRKLKIFGLVLSLSDKQKDGSRIFIADPKEKNSNNPEIIDFLKKQLGTMNK